jgi:hypothetical protein
MQLLTDLTEHLQHGVGVAEEGIREGRETHPTEIQRLAASKAAVAVPGDTDADRYSRLVVVRDDFTLSGYSAALSVYAN